VRLSRALGPLLLSNVVLSPPPFPEPTPAFVIVQTAIFDLAGYKFAVYPFFQIGSISVSWTSSRPQVGVFFSHSSFCDLLCLVRTWPRAASDWYFSDRRTGLGKTLLSLPRFQAPIISLRFFLFLSLSRRLPSCEAFGLTLPGPDAHLPFRPFG